MIYLVGFSGVGKTTIGKKLSEKKILISLIQMKKLRKMKEVVL